MTGNQNSTGNGAGKENEYSEVTQILSYRMKLTIDEIYDHETGTRTYRVVVNGERYTFEETHADRLYSTLCKGIKEIIDKTIPDSWVDIWDGYDSLYEELPIDKKVDA